MQFLTDKIIMVRPDHFGFNSQTALSNDWQNMPADAKKARDNALVEFDTMVALLREKGITVGVLSSPIDAITPDAVFPNNWFSTHLTEFGIKVVIYPMLTPNRRAERQVAQLLEALKISGVNRYELIDLRQDEEKGQILEGTGSLVLDRRHRIAYALRSQRTTKEEFTKWCDLMGYQGILYHAFNAVTNNPIYHTNVAMTVGNGFSVMCSEAITSEEERKLVTDSLRKHGELIEISFDQLGEFAGNIIHLKSDGGEAKIILSQRAFDAFTDQQRQTLHKYGELIPVQIPTIETVGGGSARCMIAEVFN